MACLFSGCLKTKYLADIDLSGVAPVIINPQSNFPSKGLIDFPLQDTLYGKTRLRLIAKYSFKTPPAKDIKVSFERNESLIQQYNTKYFTSYKSLPMNCYIMPSKQVVIPAGSLQAELPITLVPSNMNGTDNYIVAFSITDGDGVTVASNFKDFVFTLRGK